jgi:hypothetical protein
VGNQLSFPVRVGAANIICKSRNDGSVIMRFTLLLLILVGPSIAADTDIFRCSLDDGTIAFQEMPCAEPAAKDADADESAPGSGERGTPSADDVFDFVNPFDEPADSPTQPEATPPKPLSQDRTECEKTARDAIDVIDLEMREKPYSKEQGREYLKELRALTQQLRACKQL